MAKQKIEQLPQKRATWFTYWVGNEKYFQKYCYECGAKMLVLEDLV